MEDKPEPAEKTVKPIVAGVILFILGLGCFGLAFSEILLAQQNLSDSFANFMFTLFIWAIKFIGFFAGMQAGIYSYKRIKYRFILPLICFMILTTFIHFYGIFPIIYSSSIFYLIVGIVSIILIAMSKKEFVDRPKPTA